MKAILVSEIGIEQPFLIADVDLPEPRKGQVRLKMSAAALNYSDIQIAGGFYPGHVSSKLPYVAGREGAGTVDALGEGVTSVKVGDRVMALGIQGAFAEYALCFPQSVIPLPDDWSFEAGAGFQLAHLTAIAALETCAQLKAGETILIHAAAGSVGQAAITLAKHLGARVVATASSAEKLTLAQSRGADECINYVIDDFVPLVKQLTGERGVDVILDTVGGDVLQGSLESVRPYGRIVIAGNASNSPVSFTHYDLLSKYRCALVTLELGTMIIQRPDMMSSVRRRLDELTSEGVFSVEAPQGFPLEEGPMLLQKMANRELIGSTVLVL